MLCFCRWIIGTAASEKDRQLFHVLFDRSAHHTGDGDGSGCLHCLALLEPEIGVVPYLNRALVHFRLKKYSRRINLFLFETYKGDGNA